MTVSWKRLIAFVALVAITLAGTPTSVKANDGLKSERYGFKSDQQKIQVASKTQANLNRNPFRTQTVTATLSGTALTIEESKQERSSVAILMPNAAGNKSSGTTTRLAAANRNVDRNLSVGEIPAAVFSNQRGFYGSVVDAGQSAIGFAGDLYDAALDGLCIAAIADRNFDSSLTAAAARSYGVIPVRPASLDSPLFKCNVMNDGTCVVRSSEQNCMDAVAPQQVAESVPAQLSSAVIRNIRSEASDALPATNILKRPTTGNISIMVIEAFDSQLEAALPGEQLLIDRYVPCNLDGGKPAAALSVPAMMMDSHPTKPVANSSSAKVILKSTKAVVKTLLVAIKPFIGLRHAVLIPQQVRKQLMRVDELIFSSSNLKHIWNVCGSHK